MYEKAKTKKISDMRGNSEQGAAVVKKGRWGYNKRILTKQAVGVIAIHLGIAEYNKLFVRRLHKAYGIHAFALFIR